MGRQGERSCCRVIKTRQSWRNKKLLYTEWGQSCICWTYNTIPEKNTLPLHGSLWIQVNSHIESLRYNTEFLKSCSIDLISKNVKNSDFLSILYNKSLRDFGKPKSKIGDTVGILKYGLPFGKGYWPQFTQDVFEIVAIFSRKPPTCSIKDEQDENIHDKF